MPRRVDQLSVAAALASMNAALCRGPPGAVPLASATATRQREGNRRTKP